MGRLLICADNLFDLRQYPDHVITGNEEATDHAAAIVGKWRRSGTQYWTPTTANNAAYVQSAFDRVRYHNFAVTDRASTVLGETYSVTVSDDGFATSETVLSAVVPAGSAPGSVDDPTGVVNTEGSWLIRYDGRASAAVRLGVAAMGAGELPQISAAWCGLAWEFRIPDFPYIDRASTASVQQQRTSLGQMGRSRFQSVRTGQLGLRVETLPEVLPARMLEALLNAGIPAWVIWDTAYAHLGRLYLSEGDVAFQYGQESPFFPRAQISLVELDPKIT